MIKFFLTNIDGYHEGFVVIDLDRRTNLRKKVAYHPLP
jgi:hypothetical protein